MATMIGCRQMTIRTCTTHNSTQCLVHSKFMWCAKVAYNWNINNSIVEFLSLLLCRRRHRVLRILSMPEFVPQLLNYNSKRSSERVHNHISFQWFDGFLLLLMLLFGSSIEQHIANVRTKNSSCSPCSLLCPPLSSHNLAIFSLFLSTQHNNRLEMLEVKHLCYFA